MGITKQRNMLIFLYAIFINSCKSDDESEYYGDSFYKNDPAVDINGSGDYEYNNYDYGNSTDVDWQDCSDHDCGNAFFYFKCKSVPEGENIGNCCQELKYQCNNVTFDSCDDGSDEEDCLLGTEIPDSSGSSIHTKYLQLVTCLIYCLLHICLQ